MNEFRFNTDKHNSSNITILRGIDPTTPPIGLTFVFPKAITEFREETAIEGIVKYWCNSNAIVGKWSEIDWELSWNDDNTELTVYVPFVQGSFAQSHDDHILHRDAVGYGDKEFRCGLLGLFLKGYTPIRRGAGIDGVGFVPTVVDFLYDDNEVDLIGTISELLKPIRPQTTTERMEAVTKEMVELSKAMRQ